MNSDSVWQMLRYALLAIGGYFTNKGIISGDQLTAIVAAIGTLFTAAWGIYVKFGTRSTPAMTAARADVPTVSSATGATR